jgi:hypothetical protein
MTKGLGHVSRPSFRHSGFIAFWPQALAAVACFHFAFTFISRFIYSLQTPLTGVDAVSYDLEIPIEDQTREFDSTQRAIVQHD